MQAALADLKDGKPNQAELQRAVPLLADPAGRNTIRTAILTLDPFPSALMVTLLHHSALAVRLGALELLEEKAGGDFGFNPWLPPGGKVGESLRKVSRKPTAPSPSASSIRRARADLSASSPSRSRR